MELRRVLLVLDRLIHPSTKGIDQNQTLDAVRRMCHGRALTDLLPETVDSIALHARLAELEGEKVLGERANQREIALLKRKIARLRAQIERDEDAPCDFYTYDQIVQIMVRQFGKHHGVSAALVERNARLHPLDPSIGRITASMMQTWRKQDRYPAYVAAQINSMTESDLLSRGAPWSEDERKFLTECYCSDPQRSNKTLAQMCSKKFGRLITECGIKGELDRLRKAGRVSPYRPKVISSMNC